METLEVKAEKFLGSPLKLLQKQLTALKWRTILSNDAYCEKYALFYVSIFKTTIGEYNIFASFDFFEVMNVYN